MGLWNRIASLFGGRSTTGSRYRMVYALNYRCKEPVSGQVDLFNELSRAEEGSGFQVRKVLHTSGAQRCFSEVEIWLHFDKNKNVIEHEVTGGKWLDADEFEAEQARFEQALIEKEQETDA